MGDAAGVPDARSDVLYSPLIQQILQRCDVIRAQIMCNRSPKDQWFWRAMYALW